MGRVVFLTGASSGIGEALVRELSRRGYRVGLFARRKDELERLCAEIEKTGGQALALPGDATQRDQVEAAVRKLESHWGAVEVLIANAGMGAYRKSYERGGERAEQAIKLNLLGAMYCVDAVVEGMVSRGAGQIVGVSSLAGWRGLPSSAAYSASKAALTTYLETLRVDLAGKGVRVTTVHPGFVKTPLTAKNKRLPFLVEVEKAARIIADGIEGGRPEVNFPTPLVLAMRVARSLPDFLYDRLMRMSGGMG